MFVVKSNWIGAAGFLCCQSNVVWVSGLCLLSVKCVWGQWAVFAVSQVWEGSVSCVCSHSNVGKVGRLCLPSNVGGFSCCISYQSNIGGISGLCLLSVKCV